MTASASKPDQTKLLAAAVRRLERLEKASCFDPVNPTSRPTPAQQEILDDLGTYQYRWVVAGNQSGKTSLACREAAWVWSETHPGWKKPHAWGDEPLLMLIVGRTTKQLEEVIWRKIASYLDPADYHVHRVGGIIQKATHKSTGNVLIFTSHHADNEAREKLQAYVAHYVLCDEMPSSAKLLEELHRRIQARSGYFIATFTPKVLNQDIRRMVDMASAPYAKKYKLSMLDNPIYEGRKDGIMASLASLTESYRNTVLYGDWMAGEEQVYWFDWDTMVKSPVDYSTSWRHMEVVDPALKSALGLTIWAEDPRSAAWYCIHAEKISGILVPTALVEAVRERTRKYNIVRRRSDPHEVWYIATAGNMGLVYEGVYKKNDRKGELIKGLQQKLGTKIFIAPHCDSLIQEFQECRWSDQAEGKIVNASSFHLLDSSQYFADDIPVPDKTVLNVPHHTWLYEANEKRKAAAAAPTLGKTRIQRGARRW